MLEKAAHYLNEQLLHAHLIKDNCRPLLGITTAFTRSEVTFDETLAAIKFFKNLAVDKLGAQLLLDINILQHFMRNKFFSQWTSGNVDFEWHPYIPAS